MRGCLTFITLWLVVALLAIWFALPPVINGVADAGLSAAGFSGQDTVVTVDASPPLKLATLHADDVTINSTQATPSSWALCASIGPEMTSPIA